MHNRPATRADALARLTDFAPRMGAAYARGRNADHGPGAHNAVSSLSPEIRRRLITEPEVIATALRHHAASTAEKFIQEVVWRSYFKGWLERRPGIWRSYTTGLTADLAHLQDDPELAQRIETAETGTTGLTCFDAWAQELVETGYLHNHARMWFASIWIFTLRLPWRIGADFFLRHLLDGDPASNTLSWRWVGGLHTRGKTYAAQAWNIEKFTNGRFAPDPRDLATDVASLHEDEEPQGLPEATPLRHVTPPCPSTPSVLLITEEDCCIEDFWPEKHNIQATGILKASALRSPRTVSAGVAAYEARALTDAAQRLDTTAADITPENLATWATSHGASQIITAYIPEGPLRDRLATCAPALIDQGVTLTEWQRDWDKLVWPSCTAGFFKVKQKIPRLIEAAGLDRQPRLI